MKVQPGRFKKKKVKHASSCNRKEHSEEKTWHIQCIYLTKRHIHSSRFFTRYSLFSGFLSFFILLFSVFLFSDSRSVFLFFTQIETGSDFSHYTTSASIWHHSSVTFSTLCTSMYCSVHVFISLLLSWKFSSSFLDKTLQILHDQ